METMSSTGALWVRRRLALGLAPTPVTALLLSVGIMLGPQGFRLLSLNLLSYLDPAVSVALAALGVLIGLGLDIRRPLEIRLLAAGTAEASLTVLLVSLGIAAVLIARGPASPDLPIWLLAGLVGICAAPSSTVPAPSANGIPAEASRIADLDDVLPIVIGGMALALVRESTAGAAMWLLVQAVALALAVAVAGSLLVEQSTSDDEQRVFTIGAVLLLGGIAEFLSLSALLAGLVAGAFWNATGGAARDRVARDVRHMQHPLVVLLLVIAGARLEVLSGLGALVAAYVMLRVTGKLVGGPLAGWIAGTKVPASIVLQWISPGVIAVAFALNAAQAAGDRAGLVLSVVVTGSILSDLASLFGRRSKATS
ncbi:MAG: hypothetical protein HY654_09435 [Acidobacteria bacterium]|nr:hypothetical protein [Acidobacteriota bacterium]